MPSTSKKQHNFMEAVAHNPSFAKKVHIPQSVGKDFSEADKGKKFSKGGVPRPELEGVNKSKTQHGAMTLFSKGGSMKKPMMAVKKMAKGGDTTMSNPSKEKNGLTKEVMAKVRTAAPSKDGIAERGKTRAMMPKMSGSTTGMKKGGMSKMKMKK
jgi:hypothetical protein